MRLRRSKNALALQFGQRDYLQTIIEGEPINIRTLPSMKLSLLADRPSHSNEEDTKENTSDTPALISREVEDGKANNDLEEPSESKLASDVNHGKEISNLWLLEQSLLPFFHLAMLLMKHRLGKFARGM
jgi:hypothetical protein